MTYTYKCKICGIHFDGPAEKSACPRCCSLRTERLIRTKSKKIKRKKRFTGSFIVVGGKRCQECDFSEKSTISNIKLKCNCSEPEVAFRQGQWVCYSIQKKK